MASAPWAGAGSAAHWHNYETAYLLLAGLATPAGHLGAHGGLLRLLDRHHPPAGTPTIFPPYFVAGAIYAGFAMVLTLTIPLRAVFGMQDFITIRHLQNMGKVMLATGLIVVYGYAMEFFFAWYSGHHVEQFTFWNPRHRTLQVLLVQPAAVQPRGAAGAVAATGPPVAAGPLHRRPVRQLRACGSSGS